MSDDDSSRFSGMKRAQTTTVAAGVSSSGSSDFGYGTAAAAAAKAKSSSSSSSSSSGFSARLFEVARSNPHVQYGIGLVAETASSVTTFCRQLAFGGSQDGVSDDGRNSDGGTPRSQRGGLTATLLARLGLATQTTARTSPTSTAPSSYHTTVPDPVPKRMQPGTLLFVFVMALVVGAVAGLTAYSIAGGSGAGGSEGEKPLSSENNEGSGSGKAPYFEAHVKKFPWQ